MPPTSRPPPSSSCAWLGVLLAFAGCASPPAELEQPGEDWNTGEGDEGLVDPARCGEDSAKAAQPFGNHNLAYAEGSVLPNHVDRAAMDGTVARFYEGWKARYISEGCGDGRAFVASNTTDQLQTVSEAQGYGMLILAYMAGYDPDAKRLFDAMMRYVQDHPAMESAHLMAWAQGFDCASKEGAHSATDGDLDIAYALLLADKQWGSGGEIDYRTNARAIIDAIAYHTLDEQSRYVLLGSWVYPGTEYYDATRSSDFMPGHFESFAAASGDALWDGLNSASYAMVDTLQNAHAPSSGLLPDFILDPTGSARPANPGFLENDTDGAYGYNACRDPFRIGVHFLTTGDARARASLERLNTWLLAATSGDPGAIRAGYALDGSPLRDYASMAYTAPFAVGAMAGSSQEFVNDLWDVVASRSDDTYYSDTLQLLSLIALSGNWWAPESAPCPSE